MSEIEEQEIVKVMQNAQSQANESPCILNINEEEFNILNDWLNNHSGFYGESLVQLKKAFNA